MVKIVAVCPRLVPGRITASRVAVDMESFNVWNQVVELFGDFEAIDGDGGAGFFVASETLPPQSETLL